MARGMVRAVNLTMTVGAAPVKEENRISVPRCAGVPPMDMALGADPGIRNFKKPVVVRSVRIMAVSAVLNDRRMLPEEGSPSLRMTRVAVFVDACLLELGRVRCAVRVMAVGTGKLPFPERHVRRALEGGLSL